MYVNEMWFLGVFMVWEMGGFFGGNGGAKEGRIMLLMCFFLLGVF